MPREKSRYRDRRSSSYTSESSHERKKSKNKYKRRSRSRDRSESSSKKKRSNSHSRRRRKSHSRSVSRDRYEPKSRRRSSSRSRSKKSKHSESRDRSRSRSSSRSKAKYSKTNKKSRKRSSSSDSRADSFDIEPAVPSNRVNPDDTEKLEKAIKAAEAAGLTLTKIPTYEYKEVIVKEDMPSIHDRNLLAELNSDSFVQKPFTSSRSKKQSQSIVIDLNSQTVKVPESDIKVQKDDSIINFDEIPSEEELKEMWIKKLYQYRKRMLRGEI